MHDIHYVEIKMITHTIKRVFSFAADLIYPPRCPICDVFVAGCDELCLPCENTIQRLDSDAHMELPGRIWLSLARSCFAYDGPLRDALMSMKYSRRLDLARFFCNELAEEASVCGDCDVIVCVPMTASRIRGRGYNPAALLSQGLVKIKKIPCSLGALRRIRKVPPQVGLPRGERVKNVAGVFEIAASHVSNINGRRVLLIDDVLTTGATLNDCARALMKSGADKVVALTVARAL